MMPSVCYKDLHPSFSVLVVGSESLCHLPIMAGIHITSGIKGAKSVSQGLGMFGISEEDLTTESFRGISKSFPICNNIKKFIFSELV